TILASTTNGTITLTGAITGNTHALALNTGGADKIQGGASGLTTLTTDAGGTTEIQGTITSTGAQTYNDAVTLQAATTTAAGAGLVRFASTLDGGNTLAITGTGGA